MHEKMADLLSPEWNDDLSDLIHIVSTVRNSRKQQKIVEEQTKSNSKEENALIDVGPSSFNQICGLSSENSPAALDEEVSVGNFVVEIATSLEQDFKGEKAGEQHYYF